MKKKHEIIACFVVFLASIGVYTATLCPTVYSGDSGDLITSSYTLGVPHPTGYPLYVFIGKAFSYLPVGPVAYRYNLMSAFFAAATASIVCAIVLSNTKNNLAGVGAGLLTAYAKTIWDQATIAEVYTLHAFLLAATLFLILKWRREKHKKILYIAAATYGLAMTNHISTLIYLPAYAYLVLNDGWKKKRKINWELVTASFLAPLTLYLYIPIKASQKPVYNWGNPDTPIKFIDHITGAVHRRTQMLTLPKEEILERFFKIIWSMSTQVHACILLVIIGLYRHGKTQMEYAKFTGLFVCLDVVYSLFINDVSLEITSFGIPSIVVLMVWSGYGLSDALDYIKARYKRYEYSILAIASVCLLVVAVNWWECDKSSNLITYYFGQNILKTVDDGSVVFAQGDNVVFPLYYLIYVEESKNVTLVEQTGLLSHQFYGDDFFYLPQKEKYLKQKKTEYDMIKKGRPVYYTSEPEGDFPGYNAVQTGLIYKIVPENSSVGNTQYWERYDFSEIANTTINLDYMTQQIKVIYYVRLAQYYLLEDRGRAAYLLETAVKISPDDATLRYDLGNVYLGLGRIDDAIEQFKKALVRNPELPKAMNNLGYAYGLKGEKNTALKYHMTALSLDPEYTTARFNVAGILMTHGRYVEAYKHYQLIVKTEPTYAKAYLNMGLISYKMNQTNEAATYFEKYLVLDPQSDNADEIREEIRRIRGENATKQ